MGPELLHAVLVAGLLALGLYLFAHPLILKGRSNLVRGVVIWAVIVIALHLLDRIFLPWAG